MKRRPTPRIPRSPLAHVWNSPARDIDKMLAEIREHAQRGRRVLVMCSRGGAYEIVQNDTQFMVRTRGGHAVGTFGNIMAAVVAGEKHLDQRDEDDFGDDEPKGVA